MIEVLAGLVILGTLLASVSIARGRFLMQWSEADQRIRACRAADQLLATWLSGSPQAVPVHANGPLADMPGYGWQTQIIRNGDAPSMGAMVIRFEITDRRTVTASTCPILTVDFLLHQTVNPVR